MEKALLAWFDREGRDLPWRQTRDPYAILVSEVMLQQTQVERVVPRYERWLGRWPSAAALAAASPGDVIVEWQGLGYNRRALAEATIGRFKRVIGDGLHSRTDQRQATEMNVGVAVLNRMRELGRPKSVRIA